jgi:dephospho-CoA kinase
VPWNVIFPGRPRQINMSSYMLKQKKNKFVLGITGNIGCGKSTVARLFKTKDCLLIDADKLAHELIKNGSEVYKKIKNYFGKEILKKNECIDRAKLAEVVFADKLALAKLNSIIHPAIIGEIKQRIKDSAKRAIILDASLIIEAGLARMVDKLVVVKAKREQQILRSQKNLGLKRGQVVLRIKSQISQKEKLRFADFIIDNSGTINQTRKQVVEIRRVISS